MHLTGEPFFFTIGLRRVSRIIVAFEPWTEPRHVQLEELLRPFAPEAEFVGDQIAARCRVGSEEPEIVGESDDAVVTAQLKWLAMNGAIHMSRLLAHMEAMNLPTIARIVVAGADLRLPLPTTPEEIVVRDDPATPVEAAMRQRLGYISQGPEGTRLVIPGYPTNNPLSAWANAILRERAASAIVSVLAERSVDAS